MEDREDLGRLARGFYASMPEDERERLLRALWDATRRVCEERGTEATPELVAYILDTLLREQMERASALVSEFVTDEELERVERGARAPPGRRRPAGRRMSGENIRP